MMRFVFAILFIAADAKTCVKQNMTKQVLLQKGLMARSLSATGKPDPTCKTGVLSIGGQQVCCPAYCGECSDYPTCKNVNGQSSGNACCATRVLKMKCGGKVAPNICHPMCEEGVPPCIMTPGNHKMPAPSAAGEDCLEAVGEWMDKAESAVKQAKGGNKAWGNLEKAGKILKLAQQH